MTKIPAIPSVPVGITPQLAQFLGSVKEMMEIREGRRGLDADRFVTRADMENTNLLADLGLDYGSLVNSSTDPTGPPTSFSVVKGHWCNYLSWTNPTDEMFAGIEVWVNTSNDRSGATLTAVITKPAHTYVHYMFDVTNPHYYWIRARSYNPDVHSIWVPTAMMGGEVVPGDETVGETIDKMIDILKGTDPTTYSAVTTYYEHDLVKYADGVGSLRRYKCINDNAGAGISGIAPTDTTYWEQVGILMIGDIDGVPTVGIDGNLVVDGTILARHVGAGQINGDHISATSDIALASGGSFLIGSGVTLEIAEGGTLNMIGSLAITGGATGIANFTDAGALATENDIAEGDLQSGVTDRMFLDATTKSNIEAWRRAGSPTYLDGAYIYSQTITADKFISTLYGDLNQAMNFTKAVLGAGDEYEHAITSTDLSGATKTHLDGDYHIDYALSIRVAMTRLWDDGSAWWDTAGCYWDQPIETSGIWETASNDLGASESIQMSLEHQLFEDDAASTSYTVEGIYSNDNSSWGTNGTTLDDGIWETFNTRNVTGNTYRSTGNLFTFRYFKIKITLNSSDTSKRIILYNMYFKGNVVNVYGYYEGETIASGGTSFSPTGLNSTPSITVTPKGSSPLVPLVTAASSSSFTVKLYNLSGSAVGGTCDIVYMGV